MATGYGNLSQYAASGVLNHLLRTATLPKPPSLWIALASGTLNNTMTGTLGGCEMPNAGGYARQQLNCADANYAGITYVNGSGSTSNTPAIQFPQATAPWAGQVVSVAICDSGVYNGGNVWWFGTLQVPKTVGQNDQFQFAAGQLAFYMD